MAKPNQSRRERRDSPKPRRPNALLVGIVLGVLAVVALGTYEGVLRRAGVASAATNASGGGAGAAIVLQDGEALGAPVFPAGNALGGGQGQAVDGIQCGTQEYLAFHIHAHLAIFAHGKQVQLPPQVGFPTLPGAQCLYWLHTHDGSGIVHVESPVFRSFTLGNFFAIWGEPLGPSRVGSLTGAVRAFVEGRPYHGDLHAIQLGDHVQITLEVGPPYVVPPSYVFPPGDA